MVVYGADIDPEEHQCRYTEAEASYLTLGKPKVQGDSPGYDHQHVDGGNQ